MLPLSARRVTLSAYRSSAIYSRISLSSASALRNRDIPDTGIHTGLVRTFPNPQRNVSTKATATTDETKSPTESTTTGKTKPGNKLTPRHQGALEHQQEALKKQLKRQQEAQKRNAEKAAALVAEQKEAAALKRKRLAEVKKELVEAKKAKKLAEAKKAKQLAEKAKAAKEAKEKLIKPPPRRMNGFSLFLHEAKGTRTVKENAANWNNLTEEAKQEYIVRAKVVAEKRREEFEAFTKTITRADLERYNRFRRSTGSTRLHIKSLKRPPNYFAKYAAKFRMRPDQAGRPVMESTKAAGEAWRSLTQEEKDKYKLESTESTTA